MCKYETLAYHDQHGYIIYCNQCRFFQLGFGCVLISFSTSELRSFSRVVEETIEDHQHMDDSHQKSIRIPTPCESISLFLSIVEIRALHEILEQADTELTSRALLKMFVQE